MAAAGRGVLDAAHDLSDGGLAQALAEAVLRHGVGAQVSVAGVGDGDVEVDTFTALFSESAGRVLVSALPGSEDEFLSLAQEYGVETARIGVVDHTTDGLVIGAVSEADRIEVDLATLRRTHTETLPAVLGR